MRRILNLDSARHVRGMRSKSLHNTLQANVQGLVSNLLLLNLKGLKKFKRHKRKTEKLVRPRKAAKRLQLKAVKALEAKGRQQPLAKGKSRILLASLPWKRVRLAAERNPRISATS